MTHLLLVTSPHLELFSAPPNLCIHVSFRWGEGIQSKTPALAFEPHPGHLSLFPSPNRFPEPPTLLGILNAYPSLPSPVPATLASPLIST